MICKLIKPVLERVSDIKSRDGPGPMVEVTHEAQESYNTAVRREMKKKVWEKNGGVSWYVDQKTGLCTVSLSPAGDGTRFMAAFITLHWKADASLVSPILA